MLDPLTVGAIYKPLGAKALLEEDHHWGMALRFCNLTPLHVLSALSVWM